VLLDRAVVAPRLALIVRSGETLGYNPGFNVWHRVDEATAEVLRWLRAGRPRNELVAHVARRFGLDHQRAASRVCEIVEWSVLRRLLYLDRVPDMPDIGAPEHPLASVYWICTQRCNLRCSYCYQEATVARPHELSTVEAIDLVDQVVEAGADTFIITGGEPFSRRDVLEVARYSKRSGLTTNVITNGGYVRASNVDAIAEVFDLVTISLDHLRPEHHDRIRGEGSWDRAINAIDLLVAAGGRRGRNAVCNAVWQTSEERTTSSLRSHRAESPIARFATGTRGRAVGARARRRPPVFGSRSCGLILGTLSTSRSRPRRSCFTAATTSS